MRQWLLIAAVAALATPACAQESAPPPTPPPAPSPAGPGACCTAPAGASVWLEFVDTLNSKTTIRGDKFALKLAEPLIVNGKVLIPAGAPVLGEVIDAQKSGMGGKPGELLVAARYIAVNGVHVPLRGLKVSGHGTDNTKSGQNATLAFGVLGYVGVHGGEMVISAGADGSAKIAADTLLTPPESPPGQPASTPSGKSDTP